MQFSHQNSLIIKEDATRREILYDRTTRAREKEYYECVVVLSRRTISILVYTERSSLSRVKSFESFLCGKSFCKKEQNFSIEIKTHEFSSKSSIFLRRIILLLC